jgi:hypothetical protein
MEKLNRIIFKDNPYPAGHLIKEIRWSGRLEAGRGLIFDFHLETEDYSHNQPDVNEASEEKDLSDWYSKQVWQNYHSCTMSSLAWGSSGILAASADSPFDFSSRFPLKLSVDPLPLPDDVEWDDLALGIYLLGHDACAGHKINIESVMDNKYNIHWTGKIALAYVGEADFNYEFDVELYDIPFDGIYYPQQWSQNEARAMLATLVNDPDAFIFQDLNLKNSKREYKLVRAR